MHLQSIQDTEHIAAVSFMCYCYYGYYVVVATIITTVIILSLSLFLTSNKDIWPSIAFTYEIETLKDVSILGCLHCLAHNTKGSLLVNIDF